MTEAYSSQQNGVVSENQAENIRIKGKAVVDFAEKLLTLKRERIHRALTQILGLPFAFLAIFVFTSAELFFHRMAEEKFHLVFTDLRMPDTDGIAVLEYVRKLSEDIFPLYLKEQTTTKI